MIDRCVLGMFLLIFVAAVPKSHGWLIRAIDQDAVPYTDGDRLRGELRSGLAHEYHRD